MKTANMRKELLINNTYQILDNNNNVLFQGSEEECNNYVMQVGMDSLLNRIKSNPELMDVFKRLKNK